MIFNIRDFWNIVIWLMPIDADNKIMFPLKMFSRNYPLGIEPGTSYDPLLCIPDWDNLGSFS